MSKRVALAFLISAAAVLGGCAHQAGGVAPSNIPLEPGSYTVMNEVSGQDCVYRLLGIIPLSSGNETRDAMKSALSSAKGADALVNISVDTYSQTFIVVGPLLPTGSRPGGIAQSLVHWETPRLCRGGSRSLTVPGVPRGNSLS